MSAEEPLDRIVLRYLQKRGYKDAEKAFLKDSKSQKPRQRGVLLRPRRGDRVPGPLV